MCSHLDSTNTLLNAERFTGIFATHRNDAQNSSVTLADTTTLMEHNNAQTHTLVLHQPHHAGQDKCQRNREVYGSHTERTATQ
jgi:hypothetical protein